MYFETYINYEPGLLINFQKSQENFIGAKIFKEAVEIGAKKTAQEAVENSAKKTARGAVKKGAQGAAKKGTQGAAKKGGMSAASKLKIGALGVGATYAAAQSGILGKDIEKLSDDLIGDPASKIGDTLIDEFVPDFLKPFFNIKNLVVIGFALFATFIINILSLGLYGFIVILCIWLAVYFYITNQQESESGKDSE